MTHGSTPKSPAYTNAKFPVDIFFLISVMFFRGVVQVTKVFDSKMKKRGAASGRGGKAAKGRGGQSSGGGDGEDGVDATHVLGPEEAVRIAELQMNALRCMSTACRTCDKQPDPSKKFVFAAVCLIDARNRPKKGQIWVVPFVDLRYNKELILDFGDDNSGKDRVSFMFCF